MAIERRVGEIMKKIVVFLMFLFVLTACTDIENNPIDTKECESDQELIDGVCKDIEVETDTFDQDLLALMTEFHQNLDTVKIGSSKLDYIVTPRNQPIGETVKYRTIIEDKYDLTSEYYFLSMDTTITEGFDYVEYLTKTETGYETYYKTLFESKRESITLDGTFEEEVSQYPAIGFDFDITDDVLSVSGVDNTVFKVTVTKDYLKERLDQSLAYYLDDFTNEVVDLSIEFKQLDNEYEVTFSMMNDDLEGEFSKMEVVLTIKILDFVEVYVIEE